MNDVSELVLKSIRKIIRAVDLHSRKIYAEIRITGPQLVVLRELNKIQPATISMITKNSSLSQPTVSSLVKKLINKDYIAKAKNLSDKRKADLIVSDSGKKLLETAPSLLQESFLKEFEKLPSWQRHMILSSVEHLAELMNAADLSADPLLEPGINTIED